MHIDRGLAIAPVACTTWKDCQNAKTETQQRARQTSQDHKERQAEKDESWPSALDGIEEQQKGPTAWQADHGIFG